MKSKKTAKMYKKAVKNRGKQIATVNCRPNRRRVKPTLNKDFLDFDDFEDGSDKDSVSDFRIENSNGASYSIDDTANQNDDENGIGCNDNLVADDTSAVAVEQDNSKKVNLKKIEDKIHICSVCLGDVNDSENEIIYCDKCGISVHEDCYPVNYSGSSSDSSCSSTEPWFCDTCIAGVENPTCELCPNLGGIFKKTECGKWVHLVCAFYMPNVTFAEPTTLSRVKLCGKKLPRRDGKSCDLCEDTRFMYAGLTISCTAKMCKSNFHVTCAQQEGCLSDVINPEVDPKDQIWIFHKNIYGHCKLHVDKPIAKKKKENWEKLQLRTKEIKLMCEQQSSEKSAKWQRNQQSLEKLRSNYNQKKKKSGETVEQNLNSLDDIQNEENILDEEDISDDKDMENITPTLDFDFVNYWNKITSTTDKLKNEITDSTAEYNNLYKEYLIAQEEYNQTSRRCEIEEQKLSKLKNIKVAVHGFVDLCNPNARLPDTDTILTKEWHKDNYLKEKIHVRREQRYSPKIIVTQQVKSCKRKYHRENGTRTAQEQDSNQDSD